MYGLYSVSGSEHILLAIYDTVYVHVHVYNTVTDFVLVHLYNTYRLHLELLAILINMFSLFLTQILVTVELWYFGHWNQITIDMWVGSKNECLFNNVFNLQILTPSEYFRSFFFLSIEIFENKDFAFEYMNIYVLNNNF